MYVFAGKVIVHFVSQNTSFGKRMYIGAVRRHMCIFSRMQYSYLIVESAIRPIANATDVLRARRYNCKHFREMLFAAGSRAGKQNTPV